MADINSGHNIVATVYMEARTMYRADGPPELRCLGETEFVVGMAAMSASGNYGACRVCASMVGFADLQLGERVRDVLQAQIEAGRGRFRGVRQIAAWHADPAAHGSASNAEPGMLPGAQFRAGFAQLAPLGLSFDAWMYHTQLDELLDLARAFPDTKIVLNHVGGAIGIGPYASKRDEVFTTWRNSIQELARLPNLYVKLGGLGMRMFGFGLHEGPTPASSEQTAAAWGPYIETCIEAFGVERSLFESNFPVDKGTCSYPVLWNAFKRITRAYSKPERAALFSETAGRVYGVPLNQAVTH
jgi:predicted TIM-barrel fold metal-dependent hydrolase